ncbi:MAK10-like protein [Tanacetum coccineum]
MGDVNPIRTLGDYSKPSHESYRNTIDLPVGNNVLERLPAGPITTWEDLTTRFLAQFFLSGRTAKLRNDILINAKESWALLEDLALHDNEYWNDPRDFAKPVKVISLPQDVPSTSDRHRIKLENQVQRLMEAHLAPVQPTQVNKITSSCEICSGPHDTQLAFIQREVSAKMEDPGLFTLHCRLGDSKPFDTLADLGSCVNIIPLYLFKKLNIKLLEETDHIFGLADGTQSYPVRIVKDIEVRIGKLKLLNDFYVIDMKKDPDVLSYRVNYLIIKL